MLLIRTKRKELAIELGEYLLTSFRLIFLKEDLFTKAWYIFEENKMSFTDLSSVTLTELLPIKQIATFDKAFRRFEHLAVVDT